MHRYLVFLYYYCLIATIGLFVWSIGLAPNSSGLLLVVFLVPFCIYFLVVN